MDSDSTNEIVVALAARSLPCVRSRHPCGVGDPTAAGVVLSTSNLIHVVAGSAPLKDHRGPWPHTLHSLTHPKRPGDNSGGRGCASCHSIRIFRHSIVGHPVGFTVRTLRHFSGGAGPVCWCVVHVVFAFHLHVPCSETVLASRLILLFKDAGGETVQVKGHSVVVVADVEIPSRPLSSPTIFWSQHSSSPA